MRKLLLSLSAALPFFCAWMAFADYAVTPGDCRLAAQAVSALEPRERTMGFFPMVGVLSRVVDDRVLSDRLRAVMIVAYANLVERHDRGSSAAFLCPARLPILQTIAQSGTVLSWDAPDANDGDFLYVVEFVPDPSWPNPPREVYPWSISQALEHPSVDMAQVVALEPWHYRVSIFTFVDSAFGRALWWRPKMGTFSVDYAK